MEAPTITVGELKKRLEEFDDNALVIIVAPVIDERAILAVDKGDKGECQLTLEI